MNKKSDFYKNKYFKYKNKYLELKAGSSYIFDPNRKPDDLPYRDVAECYLIYKGQIVAQDSGHYLSIPGGGIDEGETPEQAGERELMEEIGSKLKNKLETISVMEWDWHPTWADTDKRKKRYMQFRGERVYSMFGIIDEFEKASDADGDAWKGPKLMSFDKASKLSKKFFENSKNNEYAYQLMKYTIISTISSINSKNLLK